MTTIVSSRMIPRYDVAAYRRLRSEGVSMSQAFPIARVVYEWSQAGAVWGAPVDSYDRRVMRARPGPNDPRVRIVVSPMDEPYEWGDLDPSPSQRKQIEAQIDRDGYWSYASEWFSEATGEWEHADSIGGIVGDLDLWYGADLMRAALDALAVETRPGTVGMRCTG